MTKSQSEILALLARYYPDATCALDHRNPYELLIATILSAQCTDERVNQVTKVLFKKYPKPAALAKAPLQDIEEVIRPTGFFRNKAKNIKACSLALVEKFGGQVPQTLTELIQLEGVGRKTASVVLGNSFGVAEGVVVDTHVRRLSGRLGLSKQKQPEKIEKDLMKLIPKERWIKISHELILHGRNVCKARRPHCERCFLNELCPSAKIE